MKRSERILLLAAGCLFGALLLAGLIASLLVTPLRKVEATRQDAARQLADLQSEKARLSPCVAAFASLRDRTFADDANGAVVAADAQVKDLAHQAGLGQSDFNLSSFSETPTTIHGDRVYRELACTVSSRKAVPLAKLVNLMYLLSRQAPLHRVSTLSISPQESGSGVNFMLRYATLVFEEKSPLPIPARKAAASQTAAVDLAAVSRTYGAITARNMFLAYVPAPKKEPVAAPPPSPPVDPNEQMVLAGLPATADGPEVHVADPDGRVLNVLKVGDKLPIGEIIAVDYRELPMPGKPSLSSYSRLIVRSGATYYAVELGQKLSERRVVLEKDLPPSLQFILQDR